MNLLNAISIGFKEIWAHKFRSLLTMMGIILGVSSLVAMSALVKGAENGMREALIAIGGLEKVRVEEADIPAPRSTWDRPNTIIYLYRLPPRLPSTPPPTRPPNPSLPRPPPPPPSP